MAKRNNTKKKTVMAGSVLAAGAVASGVFATTESEKKSSSIDFTNLTIKSSENKPMLDEEQIDKKTSNRVSSNSKSLDKIETPDLQQDILKSIQGKLSELSSAIQNI